VGAGTRALGLSPPVSQYASPRAGNGTHAEEAPAADEARGAEVGPWWKWAPGDLANKVPANLSHILVFAYMLLLQTG
jgi:hypothetical protein